MTTLQTQHNAQSTVNLQLFLDSEADPKRQFKMIDAWLHAPLADKIGQFKGKNGWSGYWRSGSRVCRVQRKS